MRRAGVVVLSASFDPGWTARVDGRPAKVFPVAPALVATSVPAGVHSVKFRYAGFSSYLVLFLLSGLSVVSLAIVDRTARARRPSPWHGPPQLRPEITPTSAWRGRGTVAVGEGTKGVQRRIERIDEWAGVLVGASGERD